MPFEAALQSPCNILPMPKPMQGNKKCHAIRKLCNPRINIHISVKQVLVCDKLADYNGKINIRLYNHPDSILALKNLKSAFIGNCFQ
jgi:hypothetical protein